MTIQDLQKFRWQDVQDRVMGPHKLREMLEAAEALWLHSGDPSDPHAVLTSSWHSDGFADVLRLLRFANVSFAYAGELSCLVRGAYDGPIDWVIGSDHAGAVFSQNVAIWLGAQHDFTEKGEGKKQNWKRFKIKPGEVVLQVEELMTTALTFEEVRAGIRRGSDGEVTFAPVAGVLLHRSPVWLIEQTKIISYVHYDINAWPQEKCPLCSSGSPAIDEPKKNWTKLTGRV